MTFDFDGIDERFFANLGIGDPKDLNRHWQAFLSEYPRTKISRRYRRLLELTGGISEVHARNYLHEDPLRYTKVSDDLRENLDRVTQAVGRILPPGSKETGQNREPPRLLRRVALFTEFRVPSERFHFFMLRMLARQAAIRGIAVSIHEVDQNLSESIETAIRQFRPDGVLLLRLTPTRWAVDVLAKRSLRTVLIHADRLEYPPPIVANITPRHDGIPKELARWLASKSKTFGDKPNVGIVTLHEEQPRGEFPTNDLFAGSIRNERHKAIRDALKHLNVKHKVIDDFSFYRAEEVLQKLPDCDLYVGLSDVIAVATKQLARHKCEVIGFDNTEIAQRAGIASFDQQLDKVARLAIEQLCAHFSGDKNRPAIETYVDVTLANR